jgi:hypothetical protein
MLGFLIASLSETVVRQSGLPATEQEQLADTCIGVRTDFWNWREEPAPAFSALVTLPRGLQKLVAAGFELLARKRNVAS